MKLAQIMTIGVHTIERNRTIREAGALLRDLDVGLLAVTDAGRIVGVITDRDLTTRGVAHGFPPDTLVGQIVSPDPVFCYADQPTGEAARLMINRQVRRVLIYDRGKRPLGVLSISDLAISAGSADLTTDVLQEVSRPATGP